MTEPTSPLQIADYRKIWFARFCSVFATTGMVVIIGYQLYDVARSQYGMSIAAASFQLGLLGLVQFVPLALLTPLAGVAADRFDRRLVGAIAVALDLAIAIALALATHFGKVTLPLLFLLAALHGSARVFVGPSVASIVPNIVPAALMPRAIAMSSIAWQTASVGGPAAAGLLFAQARDLPYWVSAVLLVLSGVSLLSIRRLPPSPAALEVHPFRQVADGFRYVWNERFLLGCVTLDLFAVLLGGATALLPVFARDILHVGSEGLGLMRASPAVGAAVVAAWLSWRPLARDVGAKMLWAVVAFGAFTIAFGLSREFAMSLGFLALLGAADMISVYVRSSLVQLHTPDEVRGRVSSISGLAISASNELGEMQSGVAAALLGATGAVVFGGVGAIVVTAIWAVAFPELRRAKTFAPQYRSLDSPKEQTT
ncbi:MAG: MFS transporter [Novosphingobium sp.]|nr:MFS transporter [Novosphingobium sp.]